MAIAHDVDTRFPSGATSTDTTAGDRTFTHTPVGTPKGVVLCMAGANTAFMTGALYGGISMTKSAEATDTSEPGRVMIWTLTDADIPTGAQTVTLQNCTTDVKWGTCSTVTAATSQTTVNDTDVVDTTTAANPTSTLNTTDTTQSYGVMHSGASAVGTAGTGCTLQHNRDYGAQVAQTLRRTSADAAGTVTLSITLASEDHCFASVALRELTAAAAPILVMAPPRAS